MRFYALYLTRFANGFWFITLITLMPEYVDLLDPSGLTLGMFYTGFTPAQTIAVVPLAWLDDRYDRRGVLLSVLVTAIVTYVLFAAVSPSVTFVSVRALQGVAVTGSGLISLALVGELAEPGTRANNMVRRGVPVIVGVLTVAFVGVYWFLGDDETTVRRSPFSELALNRRIITLRSFRAQYAVSVTLLRSWAPLFAGVSATRDGLAYASLAVPVVVVSGN